MRGEIYFNCCWITTIHKIPDKKTQRTILNRIEELSDEPDKQGKMLVKELSGFRSIHAAARYRIIYKVDKQTVIIYILAVGIRKQGDKKDIYKITRKLLKAGLLDLETDKPE
jgi:mRNA interferase RelE/StbE